jgi:methylmalonyl-CoA mutase
MSAAVETTTILPLASEFPGASDAQWRMLVDKVLEGADFEKRLVTRTPDGLAIRPLYTRADAGLPMASARGPVSAPGSWDIRQVHGHADPAATNTAILADLAGGVTSIDLRIASPGCVGLDYHQPALERALADVLLDVCPVHLHAGEYSIDAAGSLMAVWRARGLDDSQCRGGFGYDPLSTLALTGSLYHPLPRALAAAAELLRSALPHRHVRALKADGGAWHAGGATEAQELALIFASVVAYLRAAEAAGIVPRDALPKIAVTVAVDADQFLGMAKLRAVRVGLARIAEVCGAAGAAAEMEVSATTSWRMLTRRDPWVNLLRGTIACASAAMGGADAVTVLPFTWALGQPDDFARRVARNTQVVLQEESGLGRVRDPAGGSFYVERLTTDLAAAAWAEFQTIEGEGGLGHALQAGSVQQRLAAATAARRTAVARGKLELTGASAFPRLGDDGVRAEAWPAPLPTDLPGERVTPLIPERLAEGFEQLRDRADRATASRPLRVFLATLGPLAVHGTRAQWLRNLLAAGGIDAVGTEPLLTSAAAGHAFAASGCTIACLASADGVYADLGEATVQALRGAGATGVFVAGRQPEPVAAALTTAGADGFAFAGMDQVAWLTDMQRRLGVETGRCD